jgi:arylformamidase
MIDLNKYRIVELSYELVPGERKVDGRYLFGEPLAGRAIEVQEFFGLGARMHTIQGYTHVGTHVEASYKYLDEGTDLGAMPVEKYMGEAVVCNFSFKDRQEAITPDDFRNLGVISGDIVLVWAGPETADAPPYVTAEASDWLVETGIKMLGLENIGYASPGIEPGTRDNADYKCLVNGIPIIDSVHGLSQITHPRVFFMALPLRMRRVTASPTRAIALEEID